MNRGFICFLVLGLANVSLAAEDSVGSETQDASSKTIAFKYLDKNKRGATKITNADNPSFNHLSSSSGAAASADFKPSTPGTNQQFRYVYNNQYYQPNPYLAYVQIPQAAQIAAQYSFQASPVAHFLQTPTQIQYVATPTVAQVPQVKYQTFAGDYTTGNSVASDTTSSSANYVSQPQQSLASSSTQYVPQAQQTYQSSAQYVPQQSASSQAYQSSTASSASQTKQVSLYPGYQTAQPVFYQQPYFIYPNFVYQQPVSNFLLKQQQQQQIAGLYGAQRFGVYNPTQANQLTYLVPMSVTPSVQGSTATTSDLKSSGKTLSTAQQSTSANSFTYGTKA